MPRTCTIGHGSERWDVVRIEIWQVDRDGREAMATLRRKVEIDGETRMVHIHVCECDITDIQTTKTWDWPEAAVEMAAVEMRHDPGAKLSRRYLSVYRPGTPRPFVDTNGQTWEHCRLIAQDPDKWLVEED